MNPASAHPVFRWPALAAVWAMVVLLLGAAPALAAPAFPPLTGRVVDDAHILSPQTQQDLTQRLADLEARTSRQLVVVTLPSLQGYDIADYGYQLGRAWGVGQKGTNNGALFIVAPSEHKVRIEVGYGLEGVLTDALSNVILQRQVLPRFKAGDMEGGVVAGTQALIDQLGADTSTAEQRAAQAQQDQLAARRQAREEGRRATPASALVMILILVFVVGSIMRGGWFLPGLILGSLLGGRRYRDDDWGGGGFGGFGGGGGGGFSGGGGSFGGGGSSGSW